VVSATRLRGLRFWSAQTGRPLTEALLTEGEFANACFEKDQRLLATASRNKMARLWNSQLSACRTWPFIAAALSPVPGPKTEAAGLKITPWSNKRDWPAVTDSAGKELWKVEPEIEELKSVSFDRDGVFLIAIGYNKERPSKTNVAMLYDAKTGKPKAGPLRLTGQSEPADFATFSEDRRLGAILSAPRNLLWDQNPPSTLR